MKHLTHFHWNLNEVSAYSVLGFSPTASAEIEVAAVEEDAVTIELRRGGGPDEETEAQGAAAGVEEAEDDNAREEEGEKKAEGGKSYTCNKCIGHFIVLLCFFPAGPYVVAHLIRDGLSKGDEVYFDTSERKRAFCGQSYLLPQSFPIVVGEPLMLGRSKAKCAVVITDPKVSREHVRLDAPDKEHVVMVFNSPLVSNSCNCCSTIFPFSYEPDPAEQLQHRHRQGRKAPPAPRGLRRGLRQQQQPPVCASGARGLCQGRLGILQTGVLPSQNCQGTARGLVRPTF